MKFKASEMNLILLPKTHQEKYTKAGVDSYIKFNKPTH